MGCGTFSVKMSVFASLDISCISECGPRINVPGAEGGGATLPVRVWRQIKDVSWVISRNHFATTKPNEPIDIRDDQYEGRLHSETGRSLTLTDLTNQDQGIYSAFIRSQSNQQCKQLYHLQVYKTLTSEDILIHLNVTLSETHNGPCTITGTLSCAVIGSDVTLTWNNTNSPGTEVTNHTLRVYNAQSHVTYSCTARNPISEASRTAHIPCNRDNTEAPVGDYTRQNMIRLGLASVILIITSYLILQHFHGMKIYYKDLS
ncbi:SLAM family member 5 isoform X2 [Xenopus tropicalis]|uniref:SLAM family member 5 isoform X2 n=1 Tax=Xenopus tropicalis TaxID=8364 RepID=A0A8J1INQ4_XENTR|nr:SLAM family member 5 isoform X2 [Xenopus tropicalis]